MMVIGTTFCCTQIVLRFWWGKTFDWGYDVIQVTIVFALMLGAALAIHKESHTNVTMLLDRLGGRKLFLMKLVNSILTFVTCVFLLTSSLELLKFYMAVGTTTTSTLQTPTWILFGIPLSVGFAGCALLSLVRILSMLVRSRRFVPSERRLEV